LILPTRSFDVSHGFQDILKKKRGEGSEKSLSGARAFKNVPSLVEMLTITGNRDYPLDSTVSRHFPKNGGGECS